MRPVSKGPGLPRRKYLRQFGSGLVLIGLGACEIPVPGQGPPPLLYRLSPKSTFDDDLPTVAWQLLVEAPVDELRQIRLEKPDQEIRP